MVENMWEELRLLKAGKTHESAKQEEGFEFPVKWTNAEFLNHNKQFLELLLNAIRFFYFSSFIIMLLSYFLPTL